MVTATEEARTITGWNERLASFGVDVFDADAATRTDGEIARIARRTIQIGAYADSYQEEG
jgi:hypothetical protein